MYLTNTGANCNDYNADTSDDACKEGTCVGTNLCEGVNCGTAIVCRQDSICFRGKCLAGSPVKSGTSCTVKNEDDTTADSTCNANGECSPATPVITSVSPKTILLPGAIPVTVTGKNFKMGSQLEFNGVGMPTSWQNSKILVAQHPLEADISTSKSHSIGIVTPGLGRTVYKDQLTIREWKGHGACLVPAFCVLSDAIKPSSSSEDFACGQGQRTYESIAFLSLKAPVCSPLLPHATSKHQQAVG
jgi:hypothetical protein